MYGHRSDVPISLALQCSDGHTDFVLLHMKYIEKVEMQSNSRVHPQASPTNTFPAQRHLVYGTSVRRYMRTVKRSPPFCNISQSSPQPTLSSQVGKVKSAWFERDHDRMLVHAASTGHASGIPPPLPPYALYNSDAMRDAGILSGLGTVKALRQGRMRELYDKETLQYEAELSGMGLSLVKPRD